jgi:malate dehydrogenase (quinone)
MLDVIERCFAAELKAGGWSAQLVELIPSYGQSLIGNPALCRRVRADSASVLHIESIPERVVQ